MGARGGGGGCVLHVCQGYPKVRKLLKTSSFRKISRVVKE